MTALLGPTNTGKTHCALERMLEHRSGVIGLPLRLLAREVYDRLTARVGEARVALVTGEEKRVPLRPDYWVCTAESMPQGLDADFVCVDEVQMAAHRQRGHTFTERLLLSRGTKETWFLGADTMRERVQELVPVAEIRRMPRLSQLRYAGAHSLGSLPPRTAVVAFSMQEVYELAEHLRRRHGGTAVVLGALSPRARNAQVAMYEAGEVNYLVATDAIGMGLNLDVDRVVFASLHKFDGRDQRALSLAEIGQIAGRAGRYTADGKFGVLRRLSALDPRVVAAIEEHRFEPVPRLVWRNPELDFRSLDTLIASLRVRPRRPSLHLVERADDYEALVALSRRPEIVRVCTQPRRVELLWEVCRIPDFRKLLVDAHVDFLAQVFAQLVEAGRIDPVWMSRRIAHLDDVDGTIDALMSRMSFIRTWTYIAQREAWVDEPEYWQGRTAEIEDRQSDALHERLTERFVDRVAAVTPHARSGHGSARGHRRGRTERQLPTVDPDHPFHALAQLELAQAPAPKVGLDGPDVDAIVEAPHHRFELGTDGVLRFDGVALGRLRPGRSRRHPDVVMLDNASLGRGASRQIQRRLVAWVRDAVGALLGPIPRLDVKGLSAAGRGLVYQVAEGLGSVDVRQAKGQIRRIDREAIGALARAGIVVGAVGAFVPSSLTPDHQRLRAVLWAIEADRAVPAALANAGKSNVVRPMRGEAVDAYAASGYLIRAGHAVRIDVLHDLYNEAAHALGGGPKVLDLTRWSSLGLKARRVRSLLQDLGFRRDRDERWWRPADMQSAPTRRR